MDTEKCGVASVELGAGRERKGDPIDPYAGILLRKKPGDFVRKGEILAELFFAEKVNPAAAEKTLLEAYRFGDAVPAIPPLVYESIM